MPKRPVDDDAAQAPRKSGPPEPSSGRETPSPAPATGRRLSPVTAVFLIVLVDVLGFTIILPLLPFYAEHFGASPASVGALVSIYAACQLISGPFLGRLSDRVGRKPLLIVSQVGSCLGFILLAFAPNLTFVFLARALDGLTAGNISLAQATIADHTPPQLRGKAFGKIGIAFGVGFLIGPALSGYLMRYGYEVPILAGATLSGISILCTCLLLPKNAPPGVQEAANTAEPAYAKVSPGGPPSAGAAVPRDQAAGAVAKEPAPPAPPAARIKIIDWQPIRRFFAVPAMRRRLLQFFAFIMAFSMFNSGFALFAGKQLQLDGKAFGPAEVAYVLAYSGLLGIIMQGVILGRLIKRYGEVPLVTAGFIFMGCGYGVLSLATGLALALCAVTLSAFGHSLLRPCLTSLITQTADRREQGTVLGVNQSMQSMAQIIAPLLGGGLINAGLNSTWALVAGACALLGLAASWLR